MSGQPIDEQSLPESSSLSAAISSSESQPLYTSSPKTGLVQRLLHPTLLKSQVASFLATVVDLSVLFFLTEVLSVYYVISVALGALSGAVLNFTLGRHWSFQAKEGGVHQQAFRYFLVSFGSLLLNTGGVALLTETLGIHYGFSKAIVALIVGILFNYPLQRFYVFHVVRRREK